MISEGKLLKELMLISSISGDENEIGRYIFDILKNNGFETKKYPVGKGRFNVVATLGSPKIYLAAHMDTVGPMLKYKETDSYICGRGSCDTKGSAACMITAAINAKSLGLSDFGLIFTVGEETTLDGAREVVKSGLSIPFVVVGEPTSLEIVNGHFGILVVEISAKGKAAHSSRPEEGANAIDILLDSVMKVKKIPLGKGTLMSLVMLNGGIADNIIPAEAKAIFSFRISPTDKTDYIGKIRPLLTKNVKAAVIQEVKPVYCKVPQELSFIKTVKTVKYLTELSFYKKGVVLGPGDIKYAHGFDEKVPKKELVGAVEIYKKIIESFSR